MLAVILCSLLIGAILAIVAQALLLRKWFFSLPVTGPPKRPQFDKFSLPKEIQDALLDPELKKKKETCLCVNLIFQFLFNELKDTKQARRWVTKRMNNEFAEMLQTTTGRLLDQITVRDFNLGDTFPIVKHASVDNVEYRTDTQSLDEVSLLVDLIYNGGFQLAVDVDLVFGKSAYLYVKVNKLRGTARLRYSRKPFTHWSFTFIEDPLLELQVESQFEGRQISQITSLITNMIRRSVRKKHTLPNYKIRYRPFFTKPENKPPPQDVYMHGSKLSSGVLRVTVVECSRLVKVSPDSYIYCTIAIDSLPWNEMMSSKRKMWIVHDIDIIKQQSQSIGLTFKEEFIHEKFEEMVTVETVTPGSPAALADIRKSDLVAAVGSTKVTSCKQAAKLMKQAPEKFSVRIERLTSVKPQEQEVKFEEDSVSLKDSDQVPTEGMSVDEDEEYVNITVIDNAGDRSRDRSKQQRDDSIEKSLGETSTNDEKNSQPTASKKGISSILGNSSGLFHRKRGNRDNSRSPRGSPELRRRALETKETAATKPISLDPPAEEIRKRRTVSDVTPLLQEKWNKDKSDTGSLKDVNLDSSSTNSSSSQGNSKGSTAGSVSKGNTNTTAVPSVAVVGVGSAVSKSAASTEEEEEDSIDLRKTELIKSSQDPFFDECFEFDVDDSHAYLNACVWCRIPEKLDKQSRVIKPEKDIPLGHVSVSLMDVALDCVSTIQGDTKHTYKLTPAEVKATASRSKIASHPGFEERLCYGDIVLAFEHVSQPLTTKERQQIQKVREDNELTLEKQLQDQPVYAPKRVLEEGKHDFIGTHFQSATYCNFCHKKIWLKVAFQCRICGMICHKKCTQRCQEQTLCNKGGFQLRNKPAAAAAGALSMASTKKATAKDDGLTVPTGKENSTSAQQKSSFLSKFRKDSPRLPLKESAKGILQSKLLRRSQSPSPSVEGIRRHNSAPNTSESEEDVAAAAAAAAASLLSVKNDVPRTRSSTCLEDLVQENASPKLQPKELQKMKNGISSSPGSSSDSTDTEDEDEMNLLKFFERPRKGHNADEMVVTAAKEMGKELYASLDPEERREKLDAMVSKFQMEIDLESENRAELARMERETSDPTHKANIKNKIVKSDERIQSLAILMLHYCAGLQNCLDTQEQARLDEEEQKQQKFTNGLSPDEAVGTVKEGIPKIVTEEPSTCDNDDSGSDEGSPIYIKADDDSREHCMNTDSFS